MFLKIISSKYSIPFRCLLRQIEDINELYQRHLITKSHYAKLLLEVMDSLEEIEERDLFREYYLRMIDEQDN